MQITISDKKIAEAVGIVVDNVIYQNFDTAVIKAANLGKRADMIKAVMADKKFEPAMAKMIAACVTDMDLLVDQVYEVNSPVINDADAKCEEVYDEVYAEQNKRQQAEAIQTSIKALETLGYKVTKA